MSALERVDRVDDALQVAARMVGPTWMSLICAMREAVQRRRQAGDRHVDRRPPRRCAARSSSPAPSSARRPAHRHAVPCAGRPARPTAAHGQCRRHVRDGASSSTASRSQVSTNSDENSPMHSMPAQARAGRPCGLAHAPAPAGPSGISSAEATSTRPNPHAHSGAPGSAGNTRQPDIAVQERGKQHQRSHSHDGLPENRGLHADDPRRTPKVERAPGSAGFKGSTRIPPCGPHFSLQDQGDTDNSRLICVKIVFNPLYGVAHAIPVPSLPCLPCWLPPPVRHWRRSRHRSSAANT